jgi:hypothetical protein
VFLLLALALPPAAARAQPPVDATNIRFGLTPDRVRVVIDLKATVPYRIEPSADGRSLVVVMTAVHWLPAPKRTLDKMGPLLAYRFTPGPRPNEGRLELSASQPLRVLTTQAFRPDREHPTHRIMLDLAAATNRPTAVPPPLPPHTTPAAKPTAKPPAKTPGKTRPAAPVAPAPATTQAADQAEQALDQGSRAILEQRDYPDYPSALRSFRKAAALGNAQAAFNLGELYRTGKGVSQDTATAAVWYEKASAAGLPSAQFFLGVLLYNGNGVGQDRERAIGLFKRAATQNYPQAKQALDEIGQSAER